jgi:hypothetical protein
MEYGFRHRRFRSVVYFVENLSEIAALAHRHHLTPENFEFFQMVPAPFPQLTNKSVPKGGEAEHA